MPMGHFSIAKHAYDLRNTLSLYEIPVQDFLAGNVIVGMECTLRTRL